VKITRSSGGCLWGFSIVALIVVVAWDGTDLRLLPAEWRVPVARYVAIILGLALAVGYLHCRMRDLHR
jgi:hypothetical protein